MAAPEQWWVIAYLPLGSPWTYKVFQGSKTQAQAEARLAVNGKLLGPYPSKADAEAATKKQLSNPNAKPVITIPGQGALGAIGHWIGEAVAHVLDAPMWRSIGWIALGIVLMTLGIFLWLGKAGQVEPLPIPRL